LEDQVDQLNDLGIDEWERLITVRELNQEIVDGQWRAAWLDGI
jgi:hypothetical protein